MAPATNRDEPTLRRSGRIRQRNGIPSPGTAGGILLRLPPEVRDMIYALLVSVGDLSILRVSRMINTEAQFAFYRAGISRQIAGLNDHDINRSYRVSAPLIQNFELRCNLDSRLAPSSASVLSSIPGGIQSGRSFDELSFSPALDFGSCEVCRNEMLIKLDFGPRSSRASIREAEPWIRRLLQGARSFIGFKFLVVEATRIPRIWTMADKTRIGLLVNSILEPKLGPASRNDIGRIEYRPWSVVARQKYTIQSMSSLSDVLHRRVPYKRFQISSESEADEIWTDEE